MYTFIIFNFHHVLLFFKLKPFNKKSQKITWQQETFTLKEYEGNSRRKRKNGKQIAGIKTI
jgi:hypothetical protein